MKTGRYFIILFIGILAGRIEISHEYIALRSFHENESVCKSYYVMFKKEKRDE